MHLQNEQFCAVDAISVKLYLMKMMVIMISGWLRSFLKRLVLFTESFLVQCISIAGFNLYIFYFDLDRYLTVDGSKL